MSFPHGTYLGGVRSVECLRQRSFVDPESGCWHWRLAIWDKSPRVHLQDGTVTRGRRAAVRLALGRDLLPGKVAVPVMRCASDDCVNPAHAYEGTRIEHAAWMRHHGRMATPAKRLAAAAALHGQRRIKLNLEKAREIRLSDAPRIELQNRYGVGPTAINDVLNGKTWLDSAVAFDAKRLRANR